MFQETMYPSEILASDFVRSSDEKDSCNGILALGQCFWPGAKVNFGMALDTTL